MRHRLVYFQLICNSRFNGNMQITLVVLQACYFPQCFYYSCKHIASEIRLLADQF